MEDNFPDNENEKKHFQLPKSIEIYQLNMLSLSPKGGIAYLPKEEN